MPAEQLEFGVEEVLDAAEGLEPVPGHPAHLGQCIGIAPGRGAGRGGLEGPGRRWDGGGETLQFRDGSTTGRGAQGSGDPLGLRGVDGDDGVVGRQSGPVGQCDLDPRSAVRWQAGIDGQCVDPVGHRADETHTESGQVAVPVVEPRLGGGAVEHPVGLVVAAIHLQLQLQVGGEVGAGVAPVRVESREHLGHLAQHGVELRV